MRISGTKGSALLAALLVAGCGSMPAPASEPAIVTKTVEVPVPVKCRPDLGPEPRYPDNDAALRGAADLFERVKLLLAGRELRIARDGEKTAALAQCRG